MNAPKLSPLQEFVFYRTYSRWLPDLGRRETFQEVFGPRGQGRYLNYMHSKFGDKVPEAAWKCIEENLGEMGAMCSMRAAWTAGPALEKNNITGYNCAYTSIDCLQAIVELFYVLMCGTGCGYSVEKQYISQMPTVVHQTGMIVGTHYVEDSKEGWADALKIGLETWYAGSDIKFNYDFVRKAGERLKTMGGRASGPDPLRRLLEFARQLIMSAQGRKLTDVELSDLCNVVAEVVVVGGVRRSSEISFSDLESEGMRYAKHKPFPDYRWMSNNSACYTKKPTVVEFMNEWAALAASGTGERGIFNLRAAAVAAPRRIEHWEDSPNVLSHLRTNPCGEINLLPMEFCNLTEVVVRANDTFDGLLEKVKAAVWMGAMQSCLTNFPYLRPTWKETCERERLLGVSLTGQMDNPKLMTEEKLAVLKGYAVKVCRKACKALGINMSVAITTGKPSGTVSQLVNCASGCHPRHGRFYIRRVRIDAKDPLLAMLRAQGVSASPENGQRSEDVARKRAELVFAGKSSAEACVLVPDWDESKVMTWVISFPEAAPKGAITREQVTAIDQLEWYLKLKKNWCEHNQSTTVYIRDEEWLEVGSWVYKNWEDISGISFLPFDGGTYEQAPYQDIDESTYKTMLKNFPKIDYSKLSDFEDTDNTTGAQSLACSGDKCEIV